MTAITAEEALKSKKNFEEFMSNAQPEVVTSTLAEYQTGGDSFQVFISDLTQKIETFTNALNEIHKMNLENPPFIVWYVTSEKEELISVADTLNKYSTKGIKIFIFKVSLNDDKMEFKCLLKPQKSTKKYTRNENAPAKVFQQKYWEKYFEICDELQSEMQVNPKPQHFQYIPMGKRGVQIMQTVNTHLNCVATEIFINNDQTIYEKLYKNRGAIEKELGVLEWQANEGKKSSRIRKALGVELGNSDAQITGIKFQIKAAEDFKKVFSQYLV